MLATKTLCRQRPSTKTFKVTEWTKQRHVRSVRCRGAANNNAPSAYSQYEAKVMFALSKLARLFLKIRAEVLTTIGTQSVVG